MKPVALPMLHLLRHGFGVRQHRHRRLGNVGLLPPAHTENALVFVRKYFDETQHRFGPVVENPLGTGAASQFEVSSDEITDDLYILPIEHRIKINGVEIATLLGEVSAFVENVGHAAAHSGGEIPAT